MIILWSISEYNSISGHKQDISYVASVYPVLVNIIRICITDA